MGNAKVQVEHVSIKRVKIHPCTFQALTSQAKAIGLRIDNALAAIGAIPNERHRAGICIS